MASASMSILCATDFSEPAAAAVKLAGQLASKLGDRVILTHVIEIPGLLRESPPAGGWESAYRKVAGEELARAAEQLEAQGVSTETKLLVGTVAEQLHELAAQPGVRLLVMGTHGRKGTAHFFLGSVAESAARRAPCPVVATRGLPFPDDGLAGKRRLHLLVGVDGTPAAEAALAWVKQLRSDVPCDVTFWQPYWPPGEADRFGLAQAWVRKQGHPTIIPYLERELRRWVGTLPGEGEVRFRFGVFRGPESELLATEAELLQPDLVVVGTARRASPPWLASMSIGAALQNIRVPVVCVPEAMRPAADGRIPVVTSVLVGTDLSSFANQAIPAACALLRGGGGLLEICHVFEQGMNGVAVLGMPPRPALTSAERVEIERKLGELVPPEAAALGIRTQVSVVEAPSAATGLAVEAERMAADVVVLASHGRTGFARTLLGSVAEVMTRQCTRPLMVLHPVRR